MKSDDQENEESPSEGMTPAMLAPGMGAMDGPGSVAMGPFGTPQGAAAAIALAANLEDENPVNPPERDEPEEKA